MCEKLLYQPHLRIPRFKATRTSQLFTFKCPRSANQKHCCSKPLIPAVPSYYPRSPKQTNQKQPPGLTAIQVPQPPATTQHDSTAALIWEASSPPSTKVRIASRVVRTIVLDLGSFSKRARRSSVCYKWAGFWRRGVYAWWYLDMVDFIMESNLYFFIWCLGTGGLFKRSEAHQYACVLGNQPANSSHLCKLSVLDMKLCRRTQGSLHFELSFWERLAVWLALGKQPHFLWRSMECPCPWCQNHPEYSRHVLRKLAKGLALFWWDVGPPRDANPRNANGLICSGWRVSDATWRPAGQALKWGSPSAETVNLHLFTYIILSSFLLTQATYRVQLFDKIYSKSPF